MASVLAFKILLVLFCLCGSAVGSRVKLFKAKKSFSAASDDGVCKSVVNPQGYVCEEHTVILVAFYEIQGFIAVVIVLIFIINLDFR